MGDKKAFNIFMWLLKGGGSYILLNVMTIKGATAEEVFGLPDLVVESEVITSPAQQFNQYPIFNRVALDNVKKADLNGLLTGLPSTSVNQTTPGAPTNLLLRGASGGLGLVNLDGVPLFSSFVGFSPLSHYPADLFDGVELSGSYDVNRSSSRTLGGSINLSSRKINNGKAFLHTEGGSYGTLRNNMGIGTKNRLGNWSLALGRADIFEGISQATPQGKGNERDNFNMSNGLLHWDKVFERGQLESSIYYVNSHNEMDGPGIMPNRTVKWKDDPNGYTNQETWVTQVNGSYQVANNWNSSLRVGFTEDQQQGWLGKIKGKQLPMNITSQLWMAHWENAHQFNVRSKTHNSLRLVWGVDSQQQHANSPNNPSNVVTASQNLVSPLTRAEVVWGNWLASGEMKFDHYEQYGNHPIFTLNMGKNINSSLFVWTKGGTAYRAPAVNELLHPLFGSPNLVPESSRGGEVGGRWQLSRQDDISFSAYYQRYQNLIVLQQDMTTGSIKAGNINKANILGVELQAKHTWNEAWASGLSYTFMDARNQETNLKIAYRPSNLGQFWTQWQIIAPLKLRMDVTVRDAYWADAANTLAIDSAARFNANLQYQVNPKLSVYVRGENITDTRTPDIYGFNYVGAAVYGGFNVDW